MSFSVNLYTFSKKYNSTAVPTGTGTAYSCIIKNGSSIYNPKIELNIGIANDPSQYNYAHISAFDRYYFIKEWSFENGLWIAFMEVDVLATYKTQIGSSSLYILRAAGAYNGNIIDNKYPTKTGCTYSATTLTSPYNQDGCYVLGFTSRNGYFGSVTYFAMGRSAMQTICTHLIENAVVSPAFSPNDASLNLQTALINPIQYIKSCVWLPVPLDNITGDLNPTSIKIFMWQVGSLSGVKRVSNPSIILRMQNIAIPKHPDENARGTYLNSSPYTKGSIVIPPFGVIDLDTTVTCNADTLDANIYIDAMTGNGSLEILCNGIVLNKINSMVGVPVQLSQVTRDYLGAVTSLAQGVAGVAGGIASGGAAGITGAVGSGIASIGNAVQAMIPRANSIGSNGSFTQLTERYPEIDFQFFRPVDDDLTQNGRPLCEKRVVNTLSGYMLIQDGDVSISGSQQERERIKEYLETGFYYE